MLKDLIYLFLLIYLILFSSTSFLKCFCLSILTVDKNTKIGSDFTICSSSFIVLFSWWYRNQSTQKMNFLIFSLYLNIDMLDSLEWYIFKMIIVYCPNGVFFFKKKIHVRLLIAFSSLLELKKHKILKIRDSALLPGQSSRVSNKCFCWLCLPI